MAKNGLCLAMLGSPFIHSKQGKHLLNQLSPLSPLELLPDCLTVDLRVHSSKG